MSDTPPSGNRKTSQQRRRLSRSAAQNIIDAARRHDRVMRDLLGELQRRRLLPADTVAAMLGTMGVAERELNAAMRDVLAGRARFGDASFLTGGA